MKSYSDMPVVRNLLYRVVLFRTAPNGIEEPSPTAAKLKKKQKKQLEAQPEEATTETTTPLKKKKKKRKLGDATEPPGKPLSNNERLQIWPRVTHEL